MSDQKVSANECTKLDPILDDMYLWNVLTRAKLSKEKAWPDLLKSELKIPFEQNIVIWSPPKDFLNQNSQARLESVLDDNIFGNVLTGAKKSNGGRWRYL